MKLARILSLILADLLMAFALVACDKTDEQPGEEQPAEGVDTSISLQIVEKSVTDYVIVRDYKTSGTVLKAVYNMQDSFKSYLGCEIEIKECYNDRAEAEDIEQPLEILVGATNRAESAQVADGLKSNDYKVDIVGEKIVIVGGSDAATEKAIAKFLDGLVYAQGSKEDVRNQKKMDLFAYKGLTEENENYKYDVSIDKYNSLGKYSYDIATMGGARLDSYALVYPRDGAYAAENRLFAEELQAYINRQAGFLLTTKKDVAITRSDYMILVGETTFTDPALVEAIGDNEYYIGLSAREITLEDGTTAQGAVLTILYGVDAQEAAMEAFMEVMPTSPSPIAFNVSVGYVKTNMANPPAAK